MTGIMIISDEDDDDEDYCCCNDLTNSVEDIFINCVFKICHYREVGMEEVAEDCENG